MPRALPKRIGRYDVIDRLGHGGMGVVYRARDPQIDRQVAIKLLRVNDETLNRRFLKEAQSAGSLTHPNIVTIFDYGEHEEHPYLVMEFLEGLTLGQSIRADPTLTLPRKLAVMESLCKGLHYAHDKGIIHRDIKPANIMLGSGYSVKIVDFGLARLGNSGLTQSGIMVGTPNYMAPEQIEGRFVDRRTDIFAVGLVCYELLAKRRAFAGDTPIVVMNRIANDTPEPLSRVVPGIDPALERLVTQAMQKDPAQRYKTLDHMAIEIGRIRKRLGNGQTAADASTTIVLPMAAPTGREQRRPRTDPDLAQRRAQRIQHYLDVATAAFEVNHYAAAVEACEHAMLLDADDERVLGLLDRARAGQQRVLIGRINEQRREFDAGRWQPAIAALESIVPEHPLVTAALNEMRGKFAAIERRLKDEAQAQQLQQTITDHLRRAQRAFDGQQFERALAHVNAAMALSPDHDQALSWHRRVDAALEEQRRSLARKSAVDNAIATARREFAAGDHARALARLDAIVPPHSLSNAVRAEFKASLANIARQRIEAERRRHAEEHRPMGQGAGDHRQRRDQRLAAREETEVLPDVRDAGPHFQAAWARRSPLDGSWRAAADVVRSSPHATAHDRFSSIELPDQAGPSKVERSDVQTASSVQWARSRVARARALWTSSGPTRALLVAVGACAVGFVLVAGFWTRRPAAAPAATPHPVDSTVQAPVVTPAPEPSARPASTGLLIVDAIPWGEVLDVIDSRGNRVSLNGRHYTPLALSVPSESYKVTLRDPVTGATSVLNVRVTGSGAERAVATFKKVDAADYFQRAGWQEAR